MFIAIKELELHPIDFKEEFSVGAFDLGQDVIQIKPITTNGRAQLVEEHQGKHEKIQDIRLAGELRTTLQLPCARCLDPVTEEIERQFDLLYRPLGTDAGREELSVTAAEAEVGYYQGEGLQLEEALREQVLLSLPFKVLCREDCKGLCPHCGMNLNQQQCSCGEPVKDPRWAALEGLRSKFEH